MKSFVVYTAIIGGYDEIRQPLVVDDRFDYIIFSNDITEDRIGVWQIRHFEYSNPIQTKIARWVKTHPEELLRGYAASLWMDSNITIIDSAIYTLCVEHYNRGHLFATMKHPERSCIYQEMVKILEMRVESESTVLRWGHKLIKDGYPQNNGLSETGLLFRIHSHKVVQEVDLQWWDCIESFSRRDQFSFNYLIWKNNVSYEYFISEDADVHHSKIVSFFEHTKDFSKYVKFGRHEAWLCRHLEKYPQERQIIANAYYLSYKSCFPKVTAYILGQFFRIHDIIMRII